MSLKNISMYSSRVLKTVITICILTFILFFCEIIFVEVGTFYELTEPQETPQRPEGADWDIYRSQKLLKPNGEVFLRKKDQNNVFSVYDVNMVQLWEGNEDDKPEKYNDFIWARRRNSSNYMTVAEKRSMVNPEMREMEIPVIDKDEIREIWRYDIAKKIFTGYQYKGAKIGYFGGNGFSYSADKVEALNMVDLYVISSIRRDTPLLLYENLNKLGVIDFENRSLETLIDAGENTISDIGYIYWHFGVDANDVIEATGYRPIIFYHIENDGYYVKFQDGAETIRLDTPSGWKEYFRNIIRVTAVKDGVYLKRIASDIKLPDGYHSSDSVRNLFFEKIRGDNSYTITQELYKVSNQGELELVSSFSCVKPKHDRNIVNQWQDTRESLRKYSSIASPGVFGVIGKLVKRFPQSKVVKYLQANNDGLYEGYLKMVEIMTPAMWKVNIALGLAMAGISVWHGIGRRKSLKGLIGWAGFVAIFNLVGLLTYFAMCHRPTITCFSCGKKRGLNQNKCIRCGAELPKPNKELLGELQMAKS